MYNEYKPPTNKITSKTNNIFLKEHFDPMEELVEWLSHNYNKNVLIFARNYQMSELFRRKYDKLVSMLAKNCFNDFNLIVRNNKRQIAYKNNNKVFFETSYIGSVGRRYDYMLIDTNSNRSEISGIIMGVYSNCIIKYM